MNVIQLVQMIIPIYLKMKIFVMIIVLNQKNIPLLLIKTQKNVLKGVIQIVHINIGEKVKYVLMTVLN